MLIEVIYALKSAQHCVVLDLPTDTTAMAALQVSQFLELFPEIKQKPLNLGVFGERIKQPATYILEPGDRLEIYRPLSIDPKELRRLRAADSALNSA